MRSFGRACVLAFSLVVGSFWWAPIATHAQLCPSLHAEDYAPVVNKKCGNWVLQRMGHVNPTFGVHGWQLDDHGKRYILVGNYGKSSGNPNFEYFNLLDRLLLVEDADLRVGKARPLREDTIDAELDRTDVGVYLEQSYAEAMGMLPR